MAEVWLPVLGFEGIYEVSDQGRVRTTAGGGILSAASDRQGYLHLILYHNRTQQPSLAHRLVVEAFLGPFAPGEQTNHENGVKSDNRLLNLEKATPLENTRHAIATGLMLRQGEHNPQAKLSEDDVRAIRGLAGAVTGRELASRFGVTVSMISHIILRRNWRHIGT